LLPVGRGANKGLPRRDCEKRRPAEITVSHDDRETRGSKRVLDFGSGELPVLLTQLCQRTGGRPGRLDEAMDTRGNPTRLPVGI
jgi:hypothetical protein